jgi:hypothetical protein
VLCGSPLVVYPETISWMPIGQPIMGYRSPLMGVRRPVIGLPQTTRRAIGMQTGCDDGRGPRGGSPVGRHKQRRLSGRLRQPSPQLDDAAFGLFRTPTSLRGAIGEPSGIALLLTAHPRAVRRSVIGSANG